MKIAIASTGNSTLATIDIHFARCVCFVIYDTETKHYQFTENPSRTLSENAGLAVVEMISDLGVKRVISGEFGLKVKARLDELKIQMVIITDHNKRIDEIIELLKK